MQGAFAVMRLMAKINLSDITGKLGYDFELRIASLLYVDREAWKFTLGFKRYTGCGSH